MRITPLDIRKQEFKKSMRGLDGDEVYAFLGTVADEYEAVLSDNKRLREHVVQLEERLNEFKSMETNLRNTLLTAERITAEAKENARREAELIIRGAEVEAEKATESIRAHTQQLRREILELKKHKDNYVTRLRTLLENHARVVDGFEEDFAEADRELEAIGRKVEEDSRAASATPRMSRERITEDLPPREPADKATWGGDEVREEKPRPTMPLPGRPAREGRKEDSGSNAGPVGDAPVSPAQTGDQPQVETEPELELPLEQPADMARRVVAQGYQERLQMGSGYADAAGGRPAAPAAAPAPTDQWRGYEVSQAKPDWKSYEVPRQDAAGTREDINPASRAAVGKADENEVENALSGLTETGGAQAGSRQTTQPAGQAGPAAPKPQQPPQAQQPRQPQAQQPPQSQPPVSQDPAAQSAHRPAAHPGSQEVRRAAPAGPAPGQPAHEQREDGTDDAAGWTIDQLRKNLTNIDRES